MTDERPRPRRAGAPSALRTATVWASVSAATESAQETLGRALRVLDLGGGTGGLAVPLAEAGHDVTVVDPSPDALASLRRRAAEAAGASARITAVQGDADTLSPVLRGDPFDFVCCHGTLERVDDPAATLSRIRSVLAADGVLSLVTAQRLAAVLSRALTGHFDQARAVLDSPDGRWGEDDPAPRRFDRAALLALLEAAGLSTTEVHGVRLFTDLVPSAHLDSDSERTALLALEHAAHDRPALADIAAAVHVLATRR